MLKAIEIAGFKSFADRTRLEFGDGITAIVCPNGSGKSNIVDAIKWVLGEQSIKKLRSNESTDVIFSGAAYTCGSLEKLRCVFRHFPLAKSGKIRYNKPRSSPLRRQGAS